MSTALQDKDKQQRLIQANICRSKAQAEYNKVVSKRIGILDVLEKELTLLEKMRHVMGEDVYAFRLHGILAAMPLFKTRNEPPVDVIDVHDDGRDCVETTKSNAVSIDRCKSEE